MIGSWWLIVKVENKAKVIKWADSSKLRLSVYYELSYLSAVLMYEQFGFYLIDWPFCLLNR